MAPAPEDACFTEAELEDMERQRDAARMECDRLKLKRNELEATISDLREELDQTITSDAVAEEVMRLRRVEKAARTLVASSLANQMPLDYSESFDALREALDG